MRIYRKNPKRLTHKWSYEPLFLYSSIHKNRAIPRNSPTNLFHSAFRYPKENEYPTRGIILMKTFNYILNHLVKRNHYWGSNYLIVPPVEHIGLDPDPLVHFQEKQANH